MNIIRSNSIGKAWKTAFKLIVRKGSEILDEDRYIKELMHLIILIDNPKETDDIIQAQNKGNQKWMQENFTQVKKIPELHDSWSYGWRLYNFHGINQINWIIERLRKKPESKAATITMLQGAGEEEYVPCVSLLDFKIRDNKLMLTVACRSLDFGQKAIHNIINLTIIAKNVAKALNIQNIKLIIHVISAHIYKEDLNKIS